MRRLETSVWTFSPLALTLKMFGEDRNDACCVCGDKIEMKEDKESRREDVLVAAVCVLA